MQKYIQTTSRGMYELRGAMHGLPGINSDNQVWNLKKSSANFEFTYCMIYGYNVKTEDGANVKFTANKEKGSFFLTF